MDRLVLMGTHTHSGPGNFYEARIYNENAGHFSGYDPRLAEFLAGGIARAVNDAVADLYPARAGWKMREVWGLTRNRSIESFYLNPAPPLTPVSESSGWSDEFRAVDHALTMLRVDQCRPEWAGACLPVGAFSVFAIHGTGYPTLNDLLDGDIHAVAERELEQHILRLNPALAACRHGSPHTDLVRCGFRSRAFHLLANGTEGDVTPILANPSKSDSSNTRCELYLRFRPGRRPGGPRVPPAGEEWRVPRDMTVAGCLERARQFTTRTGHRLASEAIALFDSIQPDTSLELARAFTTLDLHRLRSAFPLCNPPLTGTANYGGGLDGQTRLKEWKFLWFIPSGIEQGGHAINEDERGCHGAKTIGIGPIQGPFVGRYGLPRYAHLAVVRVGNRLLATVPGEVTTEAGRRMKLEMGRRTPWSDTAVVISHANGYLQYIPTAEEYDAQRYEGASDIYGPNTAAALTEQLGALATSLSAKPITKAITLLWQPGTERSYFPLRSSGPPAPNVKRRVEGLRCTGSLVVGTWIDAYPGLLAPADGQVLEMQERGFPAEQWRHAAWDDEAAVEVRALERVEAGYRWEVRWHADRLIAGEVRLVLAARPQTGLPEKSGPPSSCLGKPAP
jgi:neutral ceramidase